MTWKALRHELDHWAALGRAAEFWWRDDDARQPSPELNVLIALARRHRAPVTLAVIPDGDRSALIDRLIREQLVTVAQHGVDHVNRAPSGAGHAEFGPDTDPEAIEPRLLEGWSALARAPRALAVFVPPWNAIHPRLPEVLLHAGYRGLSANAGPARLGGGLRRLDVHIDVLRWKGGPHFRGHSTLVEKLLEALRERREAESFDQPVGLLTHHLVHDVETWRFLDGFLALVDEHPGAAWRSLADLMHAPVVAEAA